MIKLDALIFADGNVFSALDRAMENALTPRPENGQAVCGQAHAVLDNLARTHDLPNTLSLSIEEILERAWEIAYRRKVDRRQGNIIVIPTHPQDRRRVR